MSVRLPCGERRAHRRLAATVEVRYGAGGEFRRARACDLCPAGIGLAVPVLFPVGSEIDLRFQSHDRGDLLLLKTRVRHSAGALMGLEIINLAAGEYAQFLELLSQLEQERPALAS